MVNITIQLFDDGIDIINNYTNCCVSGISFKSMINNLTKYPLTMEAIKNNGFVIENYSKKNVAFTNRVAEVIKQIIENY